MDFSKNYLVKLLNTDNEKYKIFHNQLFFMELQTEDRVILTNLETEEELDFIFNIESFTLESDLTGDSNFDNAFFTYNDENWKFQVVETYDDDEEDDIDVQEDDSDVQEDDTDVQDIVTSIDTGLKSKDDESFVIEESLIEIVGVIDKISELTRWEKQYSTKEYTESIIKSLKNVYKQKNLLYIQNKATKLLNFILNNCEDRTINSNVNYKIKENIIIPSEETYVNRNKYYSNSLAIQGLEFHPYEFTKPETLVLLAGSSILKIHFTGNVDSLDKCISIINRKKNITAERFNDNVKIIYTGDKTSKLSISEESGPHTIGFFGKLSVFKKNIEDLFDNHFGLSFLKPIVDDKRKIYDTDIEEGRDLSDSVVTTEYKEENNAYLTVMGDFNIGSNNSSQIERQNTYQSFQKIMNNDQSINEDLGDSTLQLPINKPYINNKTDGIYSYTASLLDNTIVHRNMNTLALNNSNLNDVLFQKRIAEKPEYTIYDDLNTNIQNKSKKQICVGTTPEKIFTNQPSYDLSYNDVPFFKITNNDGYQGEKINIIGFHIPSFHRYNPEFMNQGIMKEMKTDSSDNKYYHFSKYQQTKNIGYNLIDQCIENKNQILDSFTNKIQSSYNDIHNMNNELEIVDIFRNTMKEVLDAETNESSTYELRGNYFLFSTNSFIDKSTYQNLVERLYPGFLDILKIEKETLQGVMSFNSLEKILQKYCKHSDDICITNKSFVKNLFNVNFSFYRKLARLEKSLYKYNQNFYNKSNQLTTKLDKILLYNLNKSKSLEALNDIIYTSIQNSFTLNDLSNYLLQTVTFSDIQEILLNDEYEYEDKYRELLNLIINKKMEYFQKYIISSDMIYIYITDFSKKKLNKMEEKLMKILKVYDIDLQKLKNYKNFYRKNSYEVFISKFFYTINHSKDGGKLFYKYIENNNLYSQLSAFKKHSIEKIQSELQAINIQIDTLQSIFESEKERYRDYIKLSNRFKIVKVYGNIKDLTFDNKPMVFKDPKYDTLLHDKKLLDKLKMDNPDADTEVLQTLLRKKLVDIYFISSIDEIEQKVQNVLKCGESCKSYIQDNEYALLTNIGSRILLGTSVRYNGEDCTVTAVNSDNSYDLVSTSTTSKFYSVAAKKIPNYDKYITDLNNTKRVLYVRNNHVWIPLSKEDVQTNGCFISTFEQLLLNKSWEDFVEFLENKLLVGIDDISSEKTVDEIKQDFNQIGIHKFLNYKSDSEEESCIPDKIYKYLYLIENLFKNRKYFTDIVTIKTEFGSLINENNQYIEKNTKQVVKNTEFTDFKVNDSSLIPKKLMAEYLRIQQIVDINLKYEELHSFINKYGRNYNSDTGECQHFLYWNKPGVSKKLCCVHNLDLINMVYSDDKDQALRDFVQEYSVIDMEDGNFMEEDGKYCKYCSEKICNIEDLNYINEYDLTQVEENIIDPTIYEKYSPLQKKIYDTILDLFPFVTKFNESDMDFIVNQTISMCQQQNIMDIYLNTYRLNQFVENYNESILNTINIGKTKKAFKKKDIFPKDLNMDNIITIKERFYRDFSDLTMENLDVYFGSLPDDSESDLEYKKQVKFYMASVKKTLLAYNKDELIRLGGNLIPTPNNNLVLITNEIKKLSIILSLIIFILFISEGRYTIIIGDERQEKIKNLGTLDIESITTTLLILVKNKYFNKDISNDFEIKKKMTTEESKIIDDKFNGLCINFINRFLIVSNIKVITNLKQVEETYENDIFYKNFKEISEFIFSKAEFQDKLISRKPIEPVEQTSSDWETFRPLLKSQLKGDDINSNIGDLVVSIDSITNPDILKSQFNRLGRNIIDKVNDIINKSRSEYNQTYTSYLSSCCAEDVSKNSIQYFKDEINIPDLLLLLDKNRLKTSFHIDQQVFESNNHIDENFTLLDYMYPEKTEISETIDDDFKSLNMKTITRLYSDNQSYIGKDRYFKMFFDRDVFLLNQIYREDLDISNDDLKRKLKEMIEAKYSSESQLFIGGKIPFTGLHSDFIEQKIEILLSPYNGTFEIDMITGELKHNLIKKIERTSSQLSPQEKQDFINEYLKYGIVLQKVSSKVLDTKEIKSVGIDFLLEKEHSQLVIINDLLSKFTENLEQKESQSIDMEPLVTLNTTLKSIIDTKEYSQDNKLLIMKNLYSLLTSIHIKSTVGSEDLSNQINTLQNISTYEFDDFEKLQSNIDILLNIQNYRSVDIESESQLRIDDYNTKYNNKKIKFLKNNIIFLLNLILHIGNKVHNNTSFQLSNYINEKEYYKIKKTKYHKIESRNDELQSFSKQPYWSLEYKPDKKITCVCPAFTKINIYNEDLSIYKIFNNQIEPIDLFINKLNDLKLEKDHIDNLEKINLFIENEYEILDNLTRNINTNNFIYKNENYLFTDQINIQLLNFIFMYLLEFIQENTDNDLFKHVLGNIYSKLLLENNRTSNNENIFDEIITIKKNASLLRKKEYDDLDDESKMTKQVFRSLNLGNRYKNELHTSEEGQLTTETKTDTVQDGTMIDGGNEIDLSDFNQNFDHDEE